jgi:hypothetical protein
MKKIIYLCTQFMIFNILGAFILYKEIWKISQIDRIITNAPRRNVDFCLLSIWVFQNLFIG